MKFKKIILPLILLMLCSCAGKASPKAMVKDTQTPKKAQSSVSIDEGVITGVVKTSAYSDEFYAVYDRYIIDSNEELTKFLGYMNDEGLAASLSSEISKTPLSEYTLFTYPIQEGSGGYRCTVTKALVENDTFTLSSQSEGDEIMTCDMAMYYPYALVPKPQLENVRCDNWTKPSEKVVTVYKSYHVRGKFPVSATSPKTIRQLAQKFNAEYGSISLSKEQEIIFDFEFMDSKKAQAFSEETEKIADCNVTLADRTVTPQQFKKFTGNKTQLTPSSPTAEVFFMVSDVKNYSPLASFCKTKLKGEVIDECVREDTLDNMYSIKVRLETTNEDEILQLYKTLNSPPYKTDDLNVSIYYGMG